MRCTIGEIGTRDTPRPPTLPGPRKTPVLMKYTDLAEPFIPATMHPTSEHVKHLLYLSAAMPYDGPMKTQDALRACRSQVGLTQSALAIAADMHPGAVASYETGRPLTPRATARLATALSTHGCEVGTLAEFVTAAKRDCRLCADYDGVLDTLEGRR